MKDSDLLEWMENSHLVVDPVLQLIKDGWRQHVEEKYPPEACNFCSTLMTVESDGKWCPNCNTWISTK